MTPIEGFASEFEFDTLFSLDRDIDQISFSFQTVYLGYIYKNVQKIEDNQYQGSTFYACISTGLDFRKLNNFYKDWFIGLEVIGARSQYTYFTAHSKLILNIHTISSLSVYEADLGKYFQLKEKTIFKKKFKKNSGL